MLAYIRQVTPTKNAAAALGMTPSAPGGVGAAVGSALPGGSAGAAGNGVSSNIVLGKAKVLMASKDYRRVITEIDGNNTAFTDPAQPGDALY